jgi:hypothetical protein
LSKAKEREQRDEDDNEPGGWDNVPVVRLVCTMPRVKHKKIQQPAEMILTDF